MKEKYLSHKITRGDSLGCQMKHICSVMGCIICYQSIVLGPGPPTRSDPNISVLHSSPLYGMMIGMGGNINFKSVLRQSIELTLKRGWIKNNDSGLMAIFPHHLVSASSTFCALFATDKVLVVRGF